MRITEHSNERFFVNLVDHRYYFMQVLEDVDFDKTDLENLVRFQENLGGWFIPMLILCDPTTTTDVNFMYRFAQKKYHPYSQADAFVIHSVAQRILGNFYVRVFRPERPTRFFTDQAEALKWLKQFMPVKSVA